MRQYVIATLLLVGACSKAPSHQEAQSYDVAEPSAPAAPSSEGIVAATGINVTAAPGVAFNYAYAFRLPAANIAKAQEAHAAACEKLGLTRCRITGMRYTLDGNNQIAAALAFKLDPALARAFGRDGIAVIERAEGMLVNAEITGTDAGAAIERIDADKADVTDERARIERDLAQPKLSNAARPELLRQRAALDQQARAADTAKTEQQASLARTPMTFRYESGQAIRGFDPRSPFAEAADTGIASLQWTLALLLGAIALLGPPALVLLAGFLLWRRARPLVRRWGNRDTVA